MIELDMGRTFVEELVYITNESVQTKPKKKGPEILTASPEIIQQRKFISFVEKFRSSLTQAARKKEGSVKVKISKEIQTLVYNVTKLSFETWVENKVELDILFMEESTEYTSWKLVWDKNYPLSEEIIEF
jgi:hypothetical protein